MGRVVCITKLAELFKSLVRLAGFVDTLSVHLFWPAFKLYFDVQVQVSVKIHFEL